MGQRRDRDREKSEGNIESDLVRKIVCGCVWERKCERERLRERESVNVLTFY